MAFFYLQELSIKGIISRIESKDYYLLTGSGNPLIRCSLPGKFKKDFSHKKDKLYKTDIAAIGDSVDYQLNADGTGVITFVDQRKNYLSRKAPRIKGAGVRGERLEQIIASNVDNIFIVSSTLEPLFNNKVIDRFLVLTESAAIQSHIIINKCDLVDDEAISEWKELYESIGYNVLLTSAETGYGINILQEKILAGSNLFFGHSGVGKSSLLNKLYPDLELRTGKVSSFTEKGTHTTVTSIIIEAEPGIFIIDTPGIREIDPFGVSKENLGHYFIEFNKFSPECRFNTCTHNHEPGCRVIEAVEDGLINSARYDSYLRLLETVEEDIHF